MSRWRVSELLLFAVALFSAGAAAIHFSIVQEEFGSYALFGVFFAAAGLCQLAWAIWILARPSRPLLALGAAGNLAIAALWGVNRVWGLPIGPEHWHPESVGFADAAATGFEVLIGCGCLALLGAGLRRRRPASPRALALAVSVVAVGIAAMSVVSLLGAGLSFLPKAD